MFGRIIGARSFNASAGLRPGHALAAVAFAVAATCTTMAFANGQTPHTDTPPPSLVSAISPVSKPVDVRVLKQELSQVLQTVADQAGFKITLGKGLSRTISNLHMKGTASEALDTLCERIGAVWWWSGNDVKIVDRSDNVTKTIKGRDFELTLESARSLGIPVDLITTQRAEIPGIVRITGPSGLVAELETLAQDVADQVGRIHVTRYGRRRPSTVK